MSEGSTGVYRTLVKTTWLEDSSEKTIEYDWKTREYNEVPVRRKDDTITEVFGPYTLKSTNRDYSYRQIVKRVELDEPAYKREDFEYLTDYAWESQFANRKKVDWVTVANREVHHQELKAVMKQNDSGSFELAVDWVDYR